MHKENFIHRDLKTENILIHLDSNTNEFIYKLADLGLCKSLN